MDGRLFGVEFLDDAPYFIDGVAIEEAGEKLHADGEANFIGVLRCNIPVADGDHGGRSPVQRIDVLDSESFYILERYVGLTS